MFDKQGSNSGEGLEYTAFFQLSTLDWRYN